VLDNDTDTGQKCYISTTAESNIRIIKLIKLKMFMVQKFTQFI